jgi:hypothetical protein
MRSRLPLSLVILLLAFCFALGLISALLARDREPAAPPTLLPTPREEQVTILFVGVDQLSEAAPRLRAIWIASFEPPGSDLFVTGIPVDFPALSLDGRPLEEAFTWSPEDGPSPDFLAALGSVAPLAPDVVVMLDRQGFAALVDYLGGIELNGAALDGAQVTAVLELLADDPAASTASQERVLEAMVGRAEALGDSPDITPLAALVPDHARLSSPLAETIALAAPLLPLRASAVHFDTLAAPATAGDG